jgi:hypothetical protein
MSLDTPALGQAHAGHDAVLMNVKSGAAWVKNLHRHLLCGRAPERWGTGGTNLPNVSHDLVH